MACGPSPVQLPDDAWRSRSRVLDGPPSRPPAFDPAACRVGAASFYSGDLVRPLPIGRAAFALMELDDRDAVAFARSYSATVSPSLVRPINGPEVRLTVSAASTRQAGSSRREPEPVLEPPFVYPRTAACSLGGALRSRMGGMQSIVVWVPPAGSPAERNLRPSGDHCDPRRCCPTRSPAPRPCRVAAPGSCLAYAAKNRRRWYGRPRIGPPSRRLRTPYYTWSSPTLAGGRHL